MPLRAKCRDRILNGMLGAVSQNDASWKILIVDQNTLQILNACCRVHEIVSKSVTLLESLEKRRQPLKSMSAIYFLSPTESSVNQMSKDFRKNPLYRSAHVFFTSSVSQTLITYVGGTSAAPYIKTFKELNLDFLALEPLSFTLEHESSSSQKDLKGNANKNDVSKLFGQQGYSESYLTELAIKLSTVYLTLEEVPAIRYDKNSNLSKLMAQKMKQRFDAIRKTHPDFKFRGTLMLVDRGIDTLSPLLHEFTYQAMIQDLLPIKDGNIYQHKYKDGSGAQKTREVILDENDGLWVEFRHRHIAELGDEVSRRFNQHMEKNKDKANLDRDMDLKQMSKIVQDMPQFKKETAQISLHLDIVSRLLKEEFPKRKLEEIAMQEQNLAVGETPAGEKLSKVLSMINPILSDPGISKEDKMRLVMIYIMTQDGLRANHRSELMNMCDLSPEQQQTIRNLNVMGVKVVKQTKEKKKKKTKNNRNNESVSYDLSRFTPVLKEIGEKHINRQLDSNDFPYCGESAPSAAPASSTTNRFSKSLRSNKNANATSSNDAINKEPADRLLMFVLGGATYSETRSAYELDAAHQNTEVIVGSTSLITPTKFLDKLYDVKPIDNDFDTDLEFDV
eukprot:gb/GECH01013554.1/.p1 GENE.gb/GECH01013554.1/~~gb/GECH01013554.1/.p1  ORF type:complete len:619 (+),score=125.04 gb/GECH01013554.1/:1-1857(+)